MILIDTSAWVEMFRNTSKGQKAAEKMKAANATYLCVLTITELVAWAEKNAIDHNVLLNAIVKTSTYLDLNHDILRGAGISYNKFREIKPKISMIDTIIYMTAQVHGLTLLTCDNDFEGLPDVELIR